MDQERRPLRDRLGDRLGVGSEAAGRAATTMVDQCVASASNFVVGVVVARTAGPAGFGAFSLAYTCWILLNNLHRSLVTDPMAILGDARGENSGELLRQGFAAEVVLGLSATAVFAIVGEALRLAGLDAFGTGLLAVAPWVTFLDLQDYWRWVGFMQGRPRRSLANDLAFNVAQAMVFAYVLLTDHHSVAAVISAWGIGSLVGAVYGLRQFSVRPAWRGGWSLLRRRWTMSRWLVGSSAVNWGAGQVYLLVAAGILGPAALGGLKAAQALVTGPSSVVIHAGGSFGLPEASRGLSERGWPGLQRVSRLVSGSGVLSVGVFGVIVLIFGGRLLGDFYGPAFAQYEPAARLMAVALVVGAFGLGPILSLKATKQTQSVMYVQIVTLVVSVGPVVPLALLAGVNGVALVALLSSSATLAALLLYQRSARRAWQHTVGPPPGVAVLADGAAGP